MIIGMSVETFTLVHVVITLIAIASSFVVMFGMLASKKLPGRTGFCLLFTVLTSVTGFMFPIHGFTPALGTGIISMLLLALALYGLYAKCLGGAWRWIYVVTAVAAFWFNFFVLITQAFLKLKFLNPAAPQLAPDFAAPTSTYFAVAQAVALLFFVVMGLLAAKKFHSVPVQ
jgi:hypothetical protein